MTKQTLLRCAKKVDFGKIAGKRGNLIPLIIKLCSGKAKAPVAKKLSTCKRAIIRGGIGDHGN